MLYTEVNHPYPEHPLSSEPMCVHAYPILHGSPSPPRGNTDAYIFVHFAYLTRNLFVMQVVKHFVTVHEFIMALPKTTGTVKICLRQIQRQVRLSGVAVVVKVL